MHWRGHRAPGALTEESQHARTGRRAHRRGRDRRGHAGPPEPEALGRYSSEEDPEFGAEVLTLEREIAAIASVRFGLDLHGGGSSGLFLTLLGIGVGPGDQVIGPGSRSSPRSRPSSMPAASRCRRGRRLVQRRSSRCRSADHAADQSHPRRAHARGAGAARLLKDVNDRNGSQLIEDSAQDFGATYQGQGAVASALPASIASTSTRPSRVVTARMIVSRRGAVPAVLRDPRPGPRAEPTGVEVRGPPVPRPELPDDRAFRCRTAGAGPQARSDPRPPSREQGDREVGRLEPAGARLPDHHQSEGDLATHLVVTFPTPEIASASLRVSVRSRSPRRS